MMAQPPTRSSRPVPVEATQAGSLSDPRPADLQVVLGPGERVVSVGGYRVRGLLGRGGMGVVYEVEDDASHRTLALKTIETRFLELSGSNADRRFNHEIHVMARLDHPGVVRLYDYGFAHHPFGYQIAYFAMEKLDGRGLDARQAAGDLFEAADAMRCARDVTEALAYLEEHGVLHRDIKPANLFEREDGRIVLMDFGLARSSELTRLTRAGHVIGTLPYMSPEALRAEETDSTVDVYALGVVLYEMLTGVHPFTAQDPTQLVRKIEGGLEWPDDLHFEGVEVQARDLISDMLQPEPGRRPSPKEVGRRAAALCRALEPAPAAPHVETRSMFAEAVVTEPPSAPDVDRVAASRSATIPVASRGVRQVRPRATGPSWPMAIGAVVFFAALAFAGGVGVGRRAAVEPPPLPVGGLVEAPEPIPRAPPVEEPPAPEPAPTVPTFQTASEAFTWGDGALREGHHRAAIEALDQTLALNPAFARAHRRLGDAYLSLGELKDALQHYKIYHALRPTAADADQVQDLIRKVSTE